jgi:hypothetical protein
MIDRPLRVVIEYDSGDNAHTLTISRSARLFTGRSTPDLLEPSELEIAQDSPHRRQEAKRHNR